MALRYNDRTGEFEEEGGGARRTPRRPRSSSRSSVEWTKVFKTVGTIAACVALVAAGEGILGLFKKLR